MKEANDGLFAPYTGNILQIKINGADLMNLTQTDVKTKQIKSFQAILLMYGLDIS